MVQQQSTPQPAVDLPSDQLNQVQGLSVDAARGIVTVHNDSDFTLQSVDFAINLYSASGVYLHSYRFHAVAHSQCEPSSQGYLSFTPFDNDQLMNTFHGYFPKGQVEHRISVGNQTVNRRPNPNDV